LGDLSITFGTVKKSLAIPNVTPTCQCTVPTECDIIIATAVEMVMAVEEAYVGMEAC